MVFSDHLSALHWRDCTAVLFLNKEFASHLEFCLPRTLSCLLEEWHFPSMLFLSATNVEHPLCPPQPNFVRGFNYPCGCFCIPVPGEPDRTELLTFFQTDLGGYLPQTVVDSFFPSSISGFYSNLTKAVKALKAWQDELLTPPAEGRKQPVSL